MAIGQAKLGFPAKYPGICGACDEKFDVGTLIRFQGLSELVHAEPCPELDTLEAAKKPCPNCWLVHAGDCF